MSSRKANASIEHVIDVLTEEFGWDDITRDVCRTQLNLTMGANGFNERLEFICDDPVAANWRLKADRYAGPWALRIAYYGNNGEHLKQARSISHKLQRAGRPTQKETR